MSTPTPPPSFEPGTSNPKAAAKAAKAYAKASRPWFKKKRYIGTLALVVIIGIVAATSGGGSDGGPEKVAAGSGSTGADTASEDNKAGSKGNPIELGETVKLEGTQYTVKSAKTSETVGNEFSKQTAGGVFVVVELTIENTKDETKTFLSNAVKFQTNEGKSYSTDDDGTFAVIVDEEPLILEDMQPDVPKTGLLVFDVPKDKAAGGVLEVGDLFGRGNAYIDLGLT